MGMRVLRVMIEAVSLITQAIVVAIELVLVSARGCLLLIWLAWVIARELLRVATWVFGLVNAVVDE